MRALPLLCLALLVLAPSASAQVHYHDDGRPWTYKARTGPDAPTGGWFYNLGITGIRAVLVADSPKQLLVKYVFPGSPAAGRILVGDRITGANGVAFAEPHRNGYSVKVFGGHGPMMALGAALDASQTRKRRGVLTLDVLRQGKARRVKLVVARTGSYGPRFPYDCKKSAAVRAQLCAYLAKQQQEDGAWPTFVANTFAPLALLASGERRYLPHVRKSARRHAKITSRQDTSWLVNWKYCAAGIVLSEYYLATREKWVLPQLEEIRDFLMTSQYTAYSQVAESARKRKLPKTKTQALGGWGHNPGFEGYGPIAMITAQGALALALMHRCGVTVDRKRHVAAYDFLVRGTGRNGYVWYGDSPANHDEWADMGRTGASALAHWLSPYADARYAKQARAHAAIIGKRPETLPDTHGSPLMGMAYTALGALPDPASFRAMMDANRWWFTLARCTDGTFYYQPNRDNNAGDYGGGHGRVAASSVVATILSAPRKSLWITGKRAKKAGVAKTR